MLDPQLREIISTSTKNFKAYDRYGSSIAGMSWIPLSGKLLNGEFECFTLEDEHRTVKVYGETRIPAGKYKLKLRLHGGFNDRYLKKFPNMHQGMIEVCDVPNFTDVLIHIGNYEDDTAGCLLVGQGAKSVDPISISSSTNAYKAMYPKLVDIILDNEDPYIEYIDVDNITKP